MSYFYPQASVQLRIYPEDFKLTSQVDLNNVQKVTVQARNITVNVNDYKTTDTFNMEVDYKNFPFDPRTIRSCGVVISIQDMGALYDDSGAVKKIVPGTSSVIDPTRSNVVFIGFVDEESIEFDDSKRTVHFEGRDSTSLLIDQKYINNAPIAINQPIDVVIRNLLQGNVATKAIEVINRTNKVPFATLPTLAQFYPDFGSPLAGHRNTGAHESYWEIIQDLVSRAGLICYMGTTVRSSDGNIVPAIIINTPKNQAENIDDIKFVYGINVKNLKLKRKLGRFKNFNLQVRSRVGKEILIAKIPEEATKEWGVAFGFDYQPGANPETNQPVNFQPVQVPVMKPDGTIDKEQKHIAPYITFPVPNITNKDQLVFIGQTYYEQYSLQQLEGSLDTFEMVGRGSNKENGVQRYNSGKQYDLTQINKGQTICLELDHDDMAAMSRFQSEASRTHYLVQRNYDPKVATIFAKTMGKFSPRFQIKSYSMTLNQDNGFKLAIQFQNVIKTENKGLE